MVYRGHLLIWELQLVLLFFGSTEGCADGFITDEKGHCVDEDECYTEDGDAPICGVDANCFNTLGSYYCLCQPGFRSTKGKLNFTGEDEDKCQDINECTLGSIDCGINATCTNSQGGYACVCDNGFKPSNGKETFLAGQGVTCQDINECMSGYTHCGPNAKCENNNGSYACTCDDGFVTSSGDKTFSEGQAMTCRDIDECMSGHTYCGPNAKCENNNGSYACTCDDGFVTSSGDKTFSEGQAMTCQEKNECEENRSICGENAECQKKPGGYYCLCKPGYRLASGNTTFTNSVESCEEKNECEENRSICGENAECQKKPGGYYCLCKPGYRLASGNTTFTNSVESCEDICKLEPSICGGGACSQGNSGHECLCHKGYTHSGSNQEACTVLQCDLLKDDFNRSQSLGPDLDTLRSLLYNQCMGNAVSAQSRVLDAEALLMRLLSIIDDLLSKGPLGNREQVSVLLSSIERALKLLGPLLPLPQTKKSNNYSEVELLVKRGGPPPTGAVSLSSGSSKLDTHWETATGDAYPGFATIALLTYKNLEKSTNHSFGVTPDKPSQKFQINSKVVTAAVSNENTAQLKKNITLSFSHLIKENCIVVFTGTTETRCGLTKVYHGDV
ncbi:hypothetical protein ACEWY4_003357 [Coilia grayii]|uniref:EGF-like domain-containing protein n=1 Tax=Coilia grayii TaxID=363190 RepID=A0ABD1KRL6_9TELE